MSDSKQIQELSFIESFLARTKSLAQSRILKYSIFATLLLILVSFLGIRYLENEAFESRVQVRELRKFITFAIQEDLGKAVDLGIIGFSLLEGVLVEDLVISQEQDFSYNKQLLHSKKVVLKLSSVFSERPYIKKIQFIEPKLNLNSKDPFFSKLVDYLLKVNVQEVEFINAEIEVQSGDNSIMRWDKKTNWKFFKDGNRIQYKFDNGIYMIPFVQRIRGEGHIDLLEGETPKMSGFLEWKKIDIEGFTGFVQWISGFTPTNGKSDGRINLTYQKESWHIESDIDFFKTEGSFFILDERFQDMDFHTRSIYSVTSDNIEKMSQDFIGDFGSWMWEWTLENDLRKGKSKWKIQDLSILKNKFPIWDDVKFEGELIGEIEWKETGTRNNWFVFQMDNSWKNGLWEQEGWKLESQIFHSHIEDNRWKNEFQGKLFDSDFSLNSQIDLQFWRSVKPDGTIYYPMGNTGSLEIQLGELRLGDWDYLSEWIVDSIEKDIWERKQKLALKTYFTEYKIYRYLLEDMNLDFSIIINHIFTGKDRHSLPDWLLKGYIKKGSTSIRLNQEKTNNRMEFNTRFATKLPYMDFRMNLENIPWGKRFGSFCGIDTVVDEWSGKLGFRSLGADLYTINKSVNVSSSWYLKNAKLADDNSEIVRKIPFKGMDWSKNFQVEFSFNHYSENSYYRDIEASLDSENYIKGYGTKKMESNPEYNFYGRSNNESIKFNLEEGETFCK